MQSSSSVDQQPATAIGIDLGGSSVKAVSVSATGKLLRQANVDFDPEEPMAWGRIIRDLIPTLSSPAKLNQAMGVSAPGLAASDGRSIAYMPGRLEGLVGLDWTEYLQSNRTVPVLNDAHAALLGEAWIGAAKGFSNVIMLTLGTGVGGAAMVDGRLLSGHTGKAGHLGHACLDPEGPPDVCGMPGSLETAIGNCTIGDRSKNRFASTHALIKAHRAGDEEATRVWLKSVKALACAIGSFGNILDPEAVIIGGGVAKAGATLFNPLDREVRKVEWAVCGHHVKLLPAQLGDLAGAYGAAWKALTMASSGASSPGAS